MKIHILAVGKTKEPWCQKGEITYLHLLQNICDIQSAVVPEEKITPSVSKREVQKREGLFLLKKIPPDSHVVALSPDGTQMSSQEFSKFLKNIRDIGGGKACFLIGGPLGLSQEVLDTSDQIISFSSMTFPHDLFRIMLLEQLYRGLSILFGKKYHK